MAYITIDKQKFIKNLEIISNKTKDKDKIALVLKDNAYGHGLEIISNIATSFGIKKAVVKDEDEAGKIKDKFEYILILADKPKNPQSNYYYTINDINDINDFNTKVNVELKVDSGMHRNGIVYDELKLAFKNIKEKDLNLCGVFSHHSCADELNSTWFTQEQNFKKIVKTSIELAKKYGYNLHFHIDNSASLFRRDKMVYDFARVGIAAYGCLEFEKDFLKPPLEPILSLWAKKISSRRLKKGDKVGYGGAFIADKELEVSNYDIGYGDGFFRILSNNYQTPNGIQIAGRVSMDNTSFLSTNKEILIFNDARVVAKYANTISYEVLTSLKKRIKREPI